MKLISTLLLCLLPLLIAALETKYNSSRRLKPYHRQKRKTCIDETLFFWMNPLQTKRVQPKITAHACHHMIHQRSKMEYGHIVSYNYPLQYPMGRRRRNPWLYCRWFLIGLDSLLIVINDLSLRGSMDNNCAIMKYRTPTWVGEGEGDQLSIGYAFAPFGRSPTLTRILGILCGEYKDIPRDKLFYKVRKPPEGQQVWVEFNLFASMNTKEVVGKRGFVATWMHIPPFPGQSPSETAYEYVLPDGTSLRDRHDRLYHGSYIRLFIPRHSGKLTTSTVMTMHSGNRSSCRAHHIQIFDFAANKFLVENVTCKDMKISGVNIIATHIGVAKQFAPYAFVVTTEHQQVGYRGIFGVVPYRVRTKGCIRYDGSSAKKGIYIYKNGDTQPGDSCQYRANSHCTVDISKHFKDQISTFIQVRLRMSVEYSSSCIYDYIQIGGLRLCGRHKESIAVPYGKDLLVNSHGYSVRASYTSRGPARVAVDGILDQRSCYISRPENRNPYWVLYFEEKLTVWAVSITPADGSLDYVLYGRDFQLFVLDGRDKYFFDRGNHNNFTMAPGYINTVFFRPPARGKAVEIRKKSPVLALCEVAIYISLAENFISTGGWTDPEEVSRHNYVLRSSTLSYHAFNFRKTTARGTNVALLTDNDRNTCEMVTASQLQARRNSRAFLLITLPAHNIYVVYFIYLTTGESSYVNNRYIAYTSSNVALRDKRSLPPNTTRCTYEKTFNSRKTARLKCRPSIPSKFIRIDSIRYPRRYRFHLCEVQVYATYVDPFEGIINLALYKFARQSSSNKNFPASRAVDGRSVTTIEGNSCSKITSDGKSSFWVVDLANWYDINGVAIYTASFGPRPPKEVVVLVYKRDPVETGETQKGEMANGKECGRFTREMQMGSKYSIECKHTYDGRYVHLVAADKAQMILCEVEVMGSSLAPYEWFDVPQSNLSLTFHSDSKFGGSTWRTTFTPTDTTMFNSAALCGETLREADTIIRSPHSPLSYTAPGETYVCQWHVPSGAEGLTVVEVRYMVLAPHDSTDCTNDILILSNGQGQQKILCGVIWNQKYAFLTIWGSPFTVTLMVRTPKDLKPTMVYHFELRVYSFADCYYQRLRSSEGAIASPNYPEGYLPDLECGWRLRVHRKLQVDITVIDIDFGSNATRTTGRKTECLHDYLMINATTVTTGDLVWVICTPEQAQNPIHFIAQEYTFVEFTFKSGSDRAQNGRGFRLEYFTKPIDPNDTKCGFEVMTSGKTYSSPLYPVRLVFSNICTYYFRPPPDESGQFTLTMYQREIRGGNKMNVRLDLSHESGHTYIDNIRGVSNTASTRVYTIKRFSSLYIIFEPDGKTPSRWRFHVSYSKQTGPLVCDEKNHIISASAPVKTYTIGVPTGRSDLHPVSHYLPNTFCEWTFNFDREPSGIEEPFVNITILWMDLEPTARNCRGDFVRFEDMTICNTSSEYYHRTKIFTPRTWPLRLTFETDAETEGKGFKLQVTIFPRGCVFEDSHPCFDGRVFMNCCQRRPSVRMVCCLPKPPRHTFHMCVPAEECANYGLDPRVHWYMYFAFISVGLAGCITIRIVNTNCFVI